MVKDTKTPTVSERLEAWGSSSLPPSLLATLTFALHARPLQILPLTLFTTPLLFASYLNLQGFTTGAAGLSAAWSGLYALLALRKGRSPAKGFFRGALLLGGLFRRPGLTSAAQAASTISKNWGGRQLPQGLLGTRIPARGLVRGVAVGLGAANCVANGYVYATGDWAEDDAARRDRNRWGSTDS